MFHCWSQAFRIVVFLACSRNINSSWCREQREGRLIWPYHARVSSCLMHGFYGRDYRLRIWALLSAIAALPWMLDLRSWRRVVFVETGSSRWILGSAVTCAAAVLWFFENPQNTTISLCHYWFSPTFPLCRCCLSMIRVCRHNLRNCRSPYT
jgi:hypothetical protein